MTTSLREAAAGAGAGRSDTAPAPAIRERIVAAAVELLHERGIKSFTQTNVSARAGVRQSHLTYYFPTRNDLLKQAVVAAMRSLIAMFEPPASAGTDSVERVRKVLEAQLQNRRVARMMAGVVVASEEDPTLKPWLEQHAAEVRSHMRSTLAGCGVHARPGELELFHATVVGAVQLDLAASSAASSRRLRSIVRLAFDRLVRSSGEAAPRRRLQRARSRTRTTS